MGEFGDKFRKAREKKEISLDDVSNVTKISTRMLRAIENEHFDQLPGGVFNKGFIRAYAKHLGLNSDDAVSDYLACLRQAQIDSHAGWEAAGRRDSRSPVVTKAGPAPPASPVLKVQAPVEVEELPELQLPRAEHVRPAKKEYLDRPSSGISWIRIAAALCILISAFVIWNRHSRHTPAASTPSGNSSALRSSTPVAAAPASQGAQSSQSPASSTATPTPSPRATAQSGPADAPRAHAPTPAPGSTADPNLVQVEKKGDVTIRSFGGAAASKAVEKPAANLTLVVRASENSWISVTSDGQLVTQETLIAPAATSFHAARELIVRVGNAAGVSFLWNDEEVTAQGAEAEAKTFIFDSQGMHAATAPQPPEQP